MLPGELSKAAQPVPLDELAEHGVYVTIEKGECETQLERVLAREKAWDRPILAVLDTGAELSHPIWCNASPPIPAAK
jgi:hypothetical protein